jgi:hypothetical protein
VTAGDSLEHDTLAEAPGSAVGVTPPGPPEESDMVLERERLRDEAGLAERPWCSFENSEIWTVLAGEVDDED